MSKQLMFVVAAVAGLAIGAGALVWFGPEVEAIQVGAKAPDFRAYQIGTGDSITFRKEYKGDVTLVNIWATWCVPCRVEMPSMQRLYDSLSSRGFRIAAVSIDEGGPKAVRDFATEYKLTFDILQDNSGKVKDLYQTTGVPESFLLNRQGVIVKRLIGPHDWSSPVNRGLVERLLADSAE